MERYRRFITCWYATATLAEFCTTMQLDRRAASNSAAHLRRNGVALPPKPSGRQHPHGRPGTLDWAELRLVAQEAAEEQRLRAAILAGAAAADRYRRAAV
jgi:hypothetical protein